MARTLTEDPNGLVLFDFFRFRYVLIGANVHLGQGKTDETLKIYEHTKLWGGYSSCSVVDGHAVIPPGYITQAAMVDFLYPLRARSFQRSAFQAMEQQIGRLSCYRGWDYTKESHVRLLMQTFLEFVVSKMDAHALSMNDGKVDCYCLTNLTVIRTFWINTLFKLRYDDPDLMFSWLDFQNYSTRWTTHYARWIHLVPPVKVVETDAEDQKLMEERKMFFEVCLTASLVSCGVCNNTKSGCPLFCWNAKCLEKQPERKLAMLRLMSGNKATDEAAWIAQGKDTKNPRTSQMYKALQKQSSDSSRDVNEIVDWLFHNQNKIVPPHKEYRDFSY
jgi:hypothetical protein